MSLRGATRATRRPTTVADDALLRELGYPQVLARRMSGFSNYAISFSVISILSGCMTLYGYGMATGGPAVMIWGWVLVGLGVLCVGLSMAEVTSRYPTSGALYYIADRIGGRHHRAWAWATGWLNLLGLLGAIAGIDFGCAQFTGALLSLQWGFAPTTWHLIALYAAILLLHGVLNTFGVRIVGLLNSISVWWHLAGVAVIVVALAAVPSRHESWRWVFGHYVNSTGWSSPIYVGALGLLLAQYTFCGYDASAHTGEETVGAAVTAPRGIVRSIWTSWIAGFVLLVGLSFAIQNYTGELHSASGVPPAQIMFDALGATTGKLLLLVVIVAQLFCGNAEVAATSRMIFAFSRDYALPWSGVWHSVSRRSRAPRNAVWLAIVVALVLAAVPYWLGGTPAYAAVTAINVIGIYPAYAIPVYLRLRQGRRFETGPWHLGRRTSRIVGVIAVLWVACITVLFCLPQTSPVTTTSFNYAPVALAGALLLAACRWIYLAVRGTPFQGTHSYGTPEELERMEAELI